MPDRQERCILHRMRGCPVCRETREDTSVTIELPQSVWQAVEDLLAPHIEERPEYRRAWHALRGDPVPAPPFDELYADEVPSD